MGGRPLILLFAKKENISGVLILKKKKKSQPITVVFITKWKEDR